MLKVTRSNLLDSCGVWRVRGLPFSVNRSGNDWVLIEYLTVGYDQRQALAVRAFLTTNGISQKQTKFPSRRAALVALEMALAEGGGNAIGIDLAVTAQ